MPYIGVKAFESRFESATQSAALIERLTQAMVETYGEDVRHETWVVLTGVPREHWGFGGEVRA